MNKLNYLVPHDFTEVGDTALDYASNLAIRSQAEVYLVHIVKKEAHKDEEKEKLIEIIHRKKNKMPKLKLGGSVKTGNIFEDIASTAAKVESNLVIMGTHGAKGMQKVLGSFAMKVVTSTNLPFLIIQSGVSMNRVERIVFPDISTVPKVCVSPVPVIVPPEIIPDEVKFSLPKDIEPLESIIEPLDNVKLPANT